MTLATSPRPERVTGLVVQVRGLDSPMDRRSLPIGRRCQLLGAVEESRGPVPHALARRILDDGATASSGSSTDAASCHARASGSSSSSASRA